MPDYSVFVVVAYGISALVLTGLCAVVWLCGGRARRRAVQLRVFPSGN